MRRAFVAGNWKMNGDMALARSLAGGIVENSAGMGAMDIGVCPPSPYLAAVADALDGHPVMLGGQDLSVHASGAYTGEVSGAMMKDLGCEIVLVGHSERRQYHGESDVLVAEKFSRAQQSGLMPVLCVGESLAQREAGQTRPVVSAQVAAVIEHCGPQALSAAVVAYEPVWAIGTGLTASPEQAQEVHEQIREQLAQAGVEAQSVRIIYGGSVKADNAAELFAMADIDGGLIGGAALKVGDFMSICEAACN